MTSRSRRRAEDGSPPEPEATSPEEQEAGVEPAEELPAEEEAGVEPAVPAEAGGFPWSAAELPEGVYTAQEAAGSCRMCSSPIEVGGQYMVLNMGRRVHYGACSDQARAAGYMGRLESDAGPA